MRIGITPRFEESKYKSPWYAYEVELISLMRKCFPQSSIELITPEMAVDNFTFNLIVLSGGSTPGINTHRDNFEYSLLEIAMKSQTRVLGICRGAQIISIYFGSSLEKITNHVNRKRYLSGPLVNVGRCFHEFAITQLSENFETLAFYL